MALIMLMPPACSAGKNFTTSRPREMAISTSLGLEVPGVTGIPLSTQYFTTVGFRPGLTMNFAPAFTARSTCSVVRTVPAPTNMSGNSFAMIRMDSSAAAVRKVTSAQGSPPSQRALARGAASLASSRTTTGTIPIFWIFSKTSFIFRFSFALFNGKGYKNSGHNSVMRYKVSQYETQFRIAIFTKINYTRRPLKVNRKK